MDERDRIAMNKSTESLIDKDKLLLLANQMLKEQRELIVMTAEVSTESYLHNRAIGIGIERIINLIERQ